MLYQAHRGVSTECPENTMPAFRAAVAQGYQIIELDVSVTADGVLVLLHDDTINRAGRNRDGSEIAQTIRIDEITYEQALTYDFGVKKDKKFAGTPIARFDETLAFAQEAGIRLKIDNKYARFTPAQKALLFAALRPYEQTAMLTGSTVEMVREAAAHFPQMTIHYDGAVTEEIVAQLGEIVPKERLVIWLPQKNANTTWVKIAFADDALAGLVKAHAQLGLWNLVSEEERAQALAMGADMVETNGQLKPR